MQPSGKGIIVNPCPCALLQIHEEAQHIAAAHGVGAVVPWLPKYHGAAAKGIKANLFRSARLGGGDDEAGVKHLRGGVALSAIVSRKGVNLSKIPDHFIHFISIDAGVHPSHAVWCDLSIDVLKHGDEFIIWSSTTGEWIHALIIAQPQCRIPSLIVCPTIHAVSCAFVLLNSSRCPRGLPLGLWQCGDWIRNRLGWGLGRN